MKLLAIDSSGLVASVAVQSDDILVGEYTIHNKKTHSQTLLPMIAEMLEMAEIDKHELDAIAVAAGPGSFTGLRIGAATAKGLAQALNIPIVPVSTLMGLAYNLQGCEALVCPIMDARRSQAYSCVYDVRDNHDSDDKTGSVLLTENDDSDKSDTIKLIPARMCDEAAEPIETIIDRLKEWNREVIFLGDGVPVFRERIISELGLADGSVNASDSDTPDVSEQSSENGMTSGLARFSSDAARYQRASSIVALGRILFEKGHAVPAADFAPGYLRKSQAEREREEGRK
ncbi:MAG: tRNA (adenosine(37)-N6)-threonylcarbamoyltransferase complex dimerization subunit type 1 TsaB [Eubacterium sp.]|nr:tRNA (adenosine(37)-N6)-threonylcarbamoyltransferase complex dimerization subunit type 1 TsaB [Eubacterium sp.]